MIGKIPNEIFKIPSIQKPQGIEQQQKVEQGKSFGDVLKNTIAEVDSLQKEADVQIAGVVTGAPGASMHDAAIALQKADVAFQLMSSIRTKIIRAYEEVMRTQV